MLLRPRPSTSSKSVRKLKNGKHKIPEMEQSLDENPQVSQKLAGLIAASRHCGSSPTGPAH